TTIQALKKHALPKGDVLTVAQIAGIQAAKKTAELIPLCHPLPLSHVEVSFTIRPGAVEILCSAETVWQTGVEMEALAGVTVAALTLYDMCKAVDKEMRIEGIRVVEKIKE
ncbi:MAG TPA: cyclic pyranopterin monophosphate synthase MoaC, partial [Verrucomicrobiae bacterium]|nr:cyclic pyranopterin monophosphate synthase MoaC [Verrucomicrobiae bacterium]